MAVRLWGLLSSLEQRCSAATCLSSTSSSRVSTTSATTTTTAASTTTSTAAGETTNFLHHRLPSHYYCYNNRRSCSGEAAASAALGGGAAGGGAGGEDEAQSEEAEDLATRKRLEQALIELRIHNAAPDWLPLFPGGSYWIHPDQIGVTNKRPEQPSGPLLDPVNDREILAMVTPMGWPVESAAGDAMNPKSGSTR